MNFTITLLEGKEVTDILSDDNFIVSWKKLAENDKKVTVIQEPEFVTTWYRVYRNEYIPLLCIGLENKKILVGIMPLAIHRINKKIVHAGDGQAEYHGWIAEQQFDNDFPVEAIIELNKKYDIRQWHWRPMPPGSETFWLTSKKLRKEKIYIKTRTEQTPIWDLYKKNKMKKILRNKSVKSKINRFEKKGGFFIERIKDQNTTEKLLDTIAAQCDFRHKIIHNMEPFKTDPNKKKFYTEKMAYPDKNHFVVLWSNNRPIAFHHGDCDSSTVYIGLSSFCPLETKNSPGTILLIKLAQLLEKEGFRYIDLTPGGDAYKNRFANSYREIKIPHFIFGRTEKIKDIFHFLLTKINKKLIDPVSKE